jgi:serine/threonine protein kinase
MFTGKRPWHPLSDQNIVFKVHILQETKPPYPTNYISDEAFNFLDSCLEFDQEKRPSAEQLLDHPFVKVQINDDKYENLS